MYQLGTRRQKIITLLAVLLTSVGITSCSSGGADDGVKFLTSNSEGFSADAASLQGELKLVDQCFRVEDTSGNGYTVIWPKAVSYRETGNQIEFVYEGNVFARVGENVNFGGGAGSFDNKEEMEKYVNGPSGCPQPFWLL